MTDKATLLALAERVEGLDGPDRELDGSIWWATRSPEEISYLDRTGFVRECIEREGSAGRALQQFYDSANPACLARLAFNQAYTASLDAAMTLVPEGDSFTVGQNVHHGHWVASVNYLDDDGAPQSRGCSNACRTGPLALCAAALRARAETQP